MREIKFKFVYQHPESKQVAISKAYTLDKILETNEEEIYQDTCHCNCTSVGESNVVECGLGCDYFDEFVLIAKIQFTGLTDKDVFDIYESDIVKIYRQTDYLDPESIDEKDGTDPNQWNMDNAFVCKQEVKWNEYGGYSCDEDTGEYCPLLGDSDDIVVEIIGNVYKNPELLKCLK